MQEQIVWLVTIFYWFKKKKNLSLWQKNYLLTQTDSQFFLEVLRETTSLYILNRCGPVTGRHGKPYLQVH